MAQRHPDDWLHLVVLNSLIHQLVDLEMTLTKP